MTTTMINEQPNTTGIADSLLRLAWDEGAPVALGKAERWAGVLEEMAEVANEHQRAAIAVLLAPVQMHIAIATEGDR